MGNGTIGNDDSQVKHKKIIERQIHRMKFDCILVTWGEQEGNLVNTSMVPSAVFVGFFESRMIFPALVITAIPHFAGAGNFRVSSRSAGCVCVAVCIGRLWCRSPPLFI